MKFFDDINIEKLNSLLKFKTRDNNFKIKGSIELYTMKNTIKEKKTVVKRINDFLDEKFKESYINNELQKQQEEGAENNSKDGEQTFISKKSDGSVVDGEFGKDFYEQKRRLSVTSDYYNGNGSAGVGNVSVNSDENGSPTTRNSVGFGSRRPSTTGNIQPFKRRRSSSSSFSMKLNDEKLNKIINNTEYFMKMRQTLKKGTTKDDSEPTKENEPVGISDEIQVDLKDLDFQMGPFGTISDPQARKLFSQIIMILNSSFQDHDFIKIISPSDFKELSMSSWKGEFNNIINTDGTPAKSMAADANSDILNKDKGDSFEHNQAKEDTGDDAFVPPTTEKLSGLNSSDVWNILNNKINLDSCYKILEYSPDTDLNMEEHQQYTKSFTNSEEAQKDDESCNNDTKHTRNDINDEIKIEHPQINKKDFLKDELDNNDGSYVWSKLWFLINKKMKRVALIYIICSRTSPDHAEISENEQYYLDDEDAVVVTSDDENPAYGEKGTEIIGSEFEDDYDDDMEYALESDDESE